MFCGGRELNLCSLPATWEFGSQISATGSHCHLVYLHSTLDLELITAWHTPGLLSSVLQSTGVWELAGTPTSELEKKIWLKKIYFFLLEYLEQSTLQQKYCPVSGPAEWLHLWTEGGEVIMLTKTTTTKTQYLLNLLQPRLPLTPTTHAVPVVLPHCGCCKSCPEYVQWEQSLQSDNASSQTRTNTDFWGSLSTDIGPYTGLLPEVSPPSQSPLKSMQWQPRLIWHPHAIFFNYAIRRILFTVVLKPLETWKFHFPWIYSSSLSTYWFIFFFSAVGRKSKPMRPPFVVLQYQPESEISAFGMWQCQGL